MLAFALALAACSSPETLTRDGLINAGVPQPVARCMAGRMVDRLSLLQLRRLSALGKAKQSRDLEQLLHRVRSLNDPQILSVTTSSAALCAVGLGG
ncbi:hypothetical protein G4G27_18790 [Sphingomonas sp. So64.6b]|uniref:hypothetical protein n=1 Tax=Sphingomonas sp. So64.6b TaxID=2997354 RepID=UPI0016049739|nr:hypothetical protein [Sphingomonas sp. So64.6b]QNA85800.1 hypothetical protein G4G27_18790 [Sphingomonas sp. So64.6b]